MDCLIMPMGKEIEVEDLDVGITLVSVPEDLNLWEVYWE